MSTLKSVYSQKTIFAVLLLMSLLLISSATLAQTESTATVSGFGAAFSFAQTIGPIAFVETGSIGDGFAMANAFGGFGICAHAKTSTSGLAAGSAIAIDSPFAALSRVIVTSFPPGFATGFSFTC